MTSPITSFSPKSAAPTDAALDRLRELGSIGAGHAAGAFARLVGRPIRMRVPRTRQGGSRPVSHELAAWDTGIFFEVEGGPGGLLAVLFSARARDALLRALLGPAAATAEGVALGPDAESALREVGNILASQVVSAIADTLGTRVLLSVPVLALQGASTVLGAMLAERGGADALRIETEIHDGDEELRGLVVLVPGSAA
jgi:chemotaxis protein CheC